MLMIRERPRQNVRSYGKHDPISAVTILSGILLETSYWTISSGPNSAMCCESAIEMLAEENARTDFHWSSIMTPIVSRSVSDYLCITR